MNVFITGASGLIGKALTERLHAEGHNVTALVRGEPKSGENRWRPGKPLAADVLEGADAVVHLAGKNVATRWTARTKRELFASRVEGTKTISEAVAESFKHSGKPSTLISASAIGFYGVRGDEVLTETSAPGTGFLTEICQAWESATQSAKDSGVRVVHPRIGVVLSEEGGALGKVLPIFKMGAGGKLGDGRQWWSWISIEDIAGAMIFSLLNPAVQGPVNFTAPHPVTNAEFTRVLGEACIGLRSSPCPSSGCAW